MVIFMLAWDGLGFAFIHVESMVLTFFRLTPGTLGGLLGSSLARNLCHCPDSETL